VSSWGWTPGNFTTPEITYDTSNAGGMGMHLIRLAVANKFQCQNRDSVYLTFKDCTGVEENMSSFINLYPNPNNGIFLLEVATELPGPMDLSISNALSVVVFRENDPSIMTRRSKQFRLSFLPDGVYLLSLTTARGTSAHKLIIRK
jgi:hypothetical protein